jgi:hypothetical protein
MRAANHGLAEWTFGQLQTLIRHLGCGGGSMTPSVYETAQVLRFCPEHVEVDKVVNWLLGSQQRNGGWGAPEAPLYGIVSTLAAVLALRPYQTQARVRQACAAGLRWLEEQDTVIEPADGEYLPVAIELILPRLLDEAEEIGIRLARARFQHIEELGDQRRKLLAAHQPKPNSSPLFSWEAWGTAATSDLVSAAGVGHNPASTAWWLHLDRKNAATPARLRAIDAVVSASHAAGAGVIGVVPDAWPMNRFEQSFVLYLVAMAGLLTNDRLTGVLAPQLEDLRLALLGSGLGFADEFEPDGDDTGAAVAVLALAGAPVDYAVLHPFARADRFVAYPFETHGSFVVTARAAHAARALGYDTAAWRPYILKSQQADGWWTGDKWNRSRLFGTCIALAAVASEESRATTAAVQAFLNYQQPDGGWGCFGRSSLMETAYGILALCHVAATSGCETEYIEAIGAAHSYLHRLYNAPRLEAERMWICKDLYSARRVDQAAILCALLAPYALPRLSERRRARQLHRPLVTP